MSPSNPIASVPHVTHGGAVPLSMSKNRMKPMAETLIATGAREAICSFRRISSSNWSGVESTSRDGSNTSTLRPETVIGAGEGADRGLGGLCTRWTAGPSIRWE